jgi:preprotein translocase subunit YajC
MSEMSFFLAMAAPGGGQRKEKERVKMINEVKAGDRVVFSGIIGTVSNVKDKILVVKIADNVKVEVVRGAVGSVLDKGEMPSGDEKK